jgi:hypothetical protein
MRIKKLIKSEEELIRFAAKFIFPDEKIWREDDLPILEPFFEYSSGKMDRNMDEREKAGYLYYEKCREDYADELFDIRDSVANLNLTNICNAFFIEVPNMDCWDHDDDGNEIDEEGNIMPPFDIKHLKVEEEWKEELKYPLVLIGAVDSDFDRSGPMAMISIDFVCLEDFE